MKRFYLPNAFRAPQDYVIPPLDELENDTQHPELNSKTYNHIFSKYRPTDKYPDSYSHIIRQGGLFVLAANEYTTFVSTGVISGSHDFNDIAASNFKAAKYSEVFQENILGLYNIDSTAFAISTSSGMLELYSTMEKVTPENETSPNKFSIVKVKSVMTEGETTCLSTSNRGFIVGTSRGHFEMYEKELNGMFQTFTTSYAHSEEVTGISFHPVKDIWASTSSDKSCLFWDKRQAYIASPIILNHRDRLTDVHWLDTETIVVSDSAGNVMTFDSRNPKDPLCKKLIVDRAINSMRFQNNRLGIISESCKAFIYEIDQNKQLQFVHEHNAHPYMLNSLWFDDSNKKNTFYVVGDEKYAKEVTLPDAENIKQE